METERTYVNHLSHMIKWYLEPLLEEAILSEAEVGSLFGNIREIHSFQQDFLHSLEEAVEQEGDDDDDEDDDDDLEILGTTSQPLKVPLSLLFLQHFFMIPQVSAISSSIGADLLFAWACRTCSSRSAGPSYTTPTTSSCTAPSAPATPRPKRPSTRVSEARPPGDP